MSEDQTKAGGRGRPRKSDKLSASERKKRHREKLVISHRELAKYNIHPRTFLVDSFIFGCLEDLSEETGANINILVFKALREYVNKFHKHNLGNYNFKFVDALVAVDIALVENGFSTIRNSPPTPKEENGEGL
jgi:hypothetical protein